MKRRLNLLWADDDDAFAILINRIAQHPDLAERCSIHRVNDGTEAVDYMLGRNRYADRHRFPLPDAIVLDQRMCKMDGAEALSEIKKSEIARSVPICLCSTSSQQKLHDLCYGNAATFCILKPLDYGELTMKVDLLIRFFTDVLDLPRESTRV